jgi:tetratricopeptide (TPR) repeat protein
LEDLNNISPEELERIERFLDSEMDIEQSAAFSQLLLEDKTLQQKVNEVRLLRIGIDEAMLENKLDEFHTGLTSSAPQSQQGGKVISIGRRLLAAASVITIIGLSAWWFFLKETKYEKIYSDYYKADPGLLTAMGPSDNYTFEKAMVDYKNGEYDKAIEAWMSLQKNQPGSDTLNYFLGAAYQAKGVNAEAIKYLEKIAGNVNGPFYKEACWYLGLAYLKEEKIETAKDYIQRSGDARGKSLLDALNTK